MRLMLSAFLPFLALLPARQESTAQVWEKPVAPGLVYRMEYDPKIPMTIHAVRWSMQSPAVTAVPALAGTTVFELNPSKGRGTVSEIVKEYKAVGGINADFFPFTGDPLGLMVRNGELISTPAPNRVAFAWGPKEVAIGHSTFSGVMTGGGTTVQIDGMNEECADNASVLNTPAAGFAIAKVPSTMIVIKTNGGKWAPSTVMTGTVQGILEEQTQTPVERGTVVVVVRGKRAQTVSDLQVGIRVKFLLQTTGFDWESIDNAVGGGPMLLKGGKTVTDGAEEGFQPSFYNSRHPRTAVGKTAEGDLWFVIVEGRQETGAGATIEELAKVMHRLGCIDAMNLDGGGSSELNLRGVTMNRPSDGRSRPVANGIIFAPRIGMPDDQGGAVKLVVSSAVTGSKTVSAQVLSSAGRPIPNVDVLWGSLGTAGWIDQGGRIHGLENGRITVVAYAYGRRLTASVEVSGFKSKSAKPQQDDGR